MHFIGRFNRISLLCEPHSKRGLGGERRPKDKVSLQKTLLSKAIRRSKLVPHEEK
jgi:Na+-transporting NADH:ubiquinone oxidoreductase subunit NqrA